MTVRMWLRGRRGAVAAAATAACLIPVAVLGGLQLTGGEGSPQPSVTATGPRGTSLSHAHSSSPTESSPSATAAAVLDRSKPVAVRIPTIDLHTQGLVRLGLDENRRMEVPQAWDKAGWYGLAPTPGQRGPAVIVGHVDSKDGPAVFYRLRDMQEGDRVLVRRADRVIVTFRVYEMARYPKNDFPTQKVYGNTPRAELRLVTCGGSFNEASGHYRDNIVVFARMIDAHHPDSASG